MLPVHRTTPPRQRPVSEASPSAPRPTDRLIPPSPESLEGGPKLAPRPRNDATPDTPPAAAEALRPRGTFLTRMLRSPRHQSVESPSRSPLHALAAAAMRSPLHPSASAASTSATHLPTDVEREIGTWLRQSLAQVQDPAAGATPSTRTAHPSHPADARKMLKQAAAAMIEAAVSGSTVLTLDGFPGKTLPNALGDMQSLKDLILQNTEFTELPEIVAQLSQLSSLAIKDSAHLTTLPSSLVDLKNLHRLELENVPLQTWPDAIDKLKDLDALVQTGGKYEHLPDGFAELKNLYRLELGHLSRLRGLPDNLGQLQSIRFLTVQSVRRLQSLPASLTDLRLLRELDLRDNKRLEKLPIALGKLRGLASLSLNGCSALRELPASIGDLSNLRTLDLRGTGIERLPSTLSKLPAKCKILVPDHLRAQLQDIRKPPSADGAGPSHAARRPTAAPSQPSITPDMRLSVLSTELRNVDQDLARHFDRWQGAVAPYAQFYLPELTHTDLDMLEEVVATAVGSEAYRSLLQDFFVKEAPVPRDPIGGETYVEPAPEVQADLRTAYEHLLEYRIQRTNEPQEALSLLMQAIRNPDLSVSASTLLPAWSRQIWPPLLAYVTLHDKQGAAAMGKANDKAQAALNKAGNLFRMNEHEANEYSKKQQTIANAAIEKRARQLIKEWGIR